MSYVQAIVVFLLVLSPVLLPATVTGFHTIVRVLRNRRIASIQTIAGRPRHAVNPAV